MPVNLKGRSFLTLKDFTPDEIRYMLNLAADLKAKKRAGIRGNLLAGKNIVLLFEKTSTRTRCAFEVAAYDEGAHVTFLDSKSSQMGKKETMVDTAKVLGRFFDGIEHRGYDQKVVEGLAANAGVPVWNGLTDVDHPTQALADILTLMENTKKPLSKCKLVFCGDTRNNVAYCLMYICAKLGIHYVGWGPKELAPAANVVEYCREVANETGAIVEYGEDKALLKGADALYTDIWASMGEEDKIPERVKLLTPYKVTGEVMQATENADCIFLHCLPSFHDFDTTMAASQKELAPAADVVAYCEGVAKETGAVIEYGEDKALLKGADALYTDIWASMGEEDKIPERVKQLTPYKVTGDVMKATENSDCIFLHCLPSFHDFDTTMAKSQMDLGYDIREVTDEVFLSPNSKVFDEAENRMHTIKAVMVATIGNV